MFCALIVGEEPLVNGEHQVNLQKHNESCTVNSDIEGV